MAEDLIRYDILTQDALRGVVRKVLSEVAKTGLPGEHHFYVNFYTTAPGVRISSRLLADYPEEMTIVVQHQYWELKVNEHSFEISLSFGNVPEKLLVPFNALKSFFDPSVQFGLQFETITAETADADAPPAPTAAPSPIAVVHDEAPEAVEPATLRLDADNNPAAEPSEGKVQADSTPAADDSDDAVDDSDDKDKQPREADVVSLDAFRKK
ncbi:MAG: SspB family protein [Alphaproteobacteria bacterium]